MLSYMIGTYFICLTFGWSLLGLDFLFVRIERQQKSEPWISDAVIIGGASAVLSPIIQWSNTIIQTSKSVSTASRLPVAAQLNVAQTSGCLLQPRNKSNIYCVFVGSFEFCT